MEEQTPEIQQDTGPQVSFPPQSAQTPKKTNKAIPLILMVLAIILIGAGAFFYLGKKSQNNSPTPTPESAGIRVVNDFTPEPEAESTPEPIDRAGITMEVLNGTGISGEASYLEGVLNDLGYTDVTVGNADNSDYIDTTITFKSDSSDSLISELKDELEKIYKKVVTKSSSTQKSDVVIITGLKTGATPKASAVPTPKASTTPVPTESPDTTPSPTPES